MTEIFQREYPMLRSLDYKFSMGCEILKKEIMEGSFLVQCTCRRTQKAGWDILINRHKFFRFVHVTGQEAFGQRCFMTICSDANEGGTALIRPSDYMCNWKGFFM